MAKNPFTEFTEQFVKTLEKQRKEMEKLVKPFFEYPKQVERTTNPFLDYQRKTMEMTGSILEFHQAFLEESQRFQESVQNVFETIGEMSKRMTAEQKKQAEKGEKLLSEETLPTKVEKFILNTKELQEKWVEQFEEAADMIEKFIPKQK